MPIAVAQIAEIAIINADFEAMARELAEAVVAAAGDTTGTIMVGPATHIADGAVFGIYVFMILTQRERAPRIIVAECATAASVGGQLKRRCHDAIVAALGCRCSDVRIFTSEHALFAAACAPHENAPPLIH